MITIRNEIPLSNVVTPEMETELKNAGLRAVAVGVIVEPISSVCTTYTVKSGDTLSQIAARHNTTVARLVEINSISNPDKIFVGQIIKIY